MDPERWERIKQLFQSVLGRDPSDRSAFLAEACASDPDLRREVETLISSHEQAGGFLEEPALAAEPELLLEENALPQSAEEGSRLSVGQQVGPYRLTAEIGRGGMGAVYLAERADGQYRKKVAIKLVKRGMDTEAILRRFRKERQILAGLDHPNIARFLDGGTTEEGLPYFVMEYIQGKSFFEYCDVEKLPVSERLKLFRSVCSAVQHAHNCQIVHRDLKPSNILVTAEGIPKLLDFGIAKLLSPEPFSQTAELTATGFHLMTPDYASPEQVRGEEITTATDVYSLGVVLYELLTGHRPYRLKAHGPQEIAKAICEEEPEMPSSAVSRIEEVPAPDGTSPDRLTSESVAQTREGNPAKLRRRLAGDLDNIVLKAIRKEPYRRYQSVEQLSEDIRRHLEGLPVIARKDTLGYRTVKLIRRRKARLATAALVLLTILATTLLTLQGRQSRLRGAESTAGPQIRSIAVLPLENLSRDPEQEYFADGMTDALINDLARIGALRVVSRTSVMRFKGTQKTLRQIGHELNADAIVEGSILRAGDRVRLTAQLIHAPSDRHLWANSYERDLQDALALQSEVAHSIAREIRVVLTPQEEERLTSAGPVNREAYDAYLKGRYAWNQRTEERLLKGIEYFQTAIEKDPNFVLAYSGLADSYNLLGSFDSGGLPPREAFPKARTAAERALEIDERLAEAHASLGYTKLFYDWDWSGAQAEFKRAVELNPNYANTHMWYALYFAALGRFDEAIGEIRRAKELDPTSLVIIQGVGRHLYLARRYDEAIEQIRQSLELDPRFPRARMRLGDAYVQKRMFPEAIAELREALALSGGSPNVMGALGRAYALSGQRDEAMKVLDDLRVLSERRYVSPFAIALVYTGLGEKDQAFAWLRKSAEERSGLLFLSAVLPELDSLRSDPRFAELLRQIGLPQPSSRRASR